MSALSPSHGSTVLKIKFTKASPNTRMNADKIYQPVLESDPIAGKFRVKSPTAGSAHFPQWDSPKATAMEVCWACTFFYCYPSFSTKLLKAAHRIEQRKKKIPQLKGILKPKERLPLIPVRFESSLPQVIALETHIIL